MIVTCEKCQKDFNPILKEENRTDGKNQIITRAYFVCPFCGLQYNCYYDNQKTLTLRKQVRKHRSMLDWHNNLDEHQINKVKRTVEKKQRQIEKEEMKIKAIFGKEN